MNDVDVRIIGAYQVSVSYADPYGVYLPDQVLENSPVQAGDPITLRFQGDDGEEREIHAKAASREDFEVEEEVHALFYGIARCINSLPESFEESFSRFRGEQPDDIAIDELNELQSYLQELTKHKSRFTEEDVIIGCGFFELFLKEKRVVKEQIKTPLFHIDEPTFAELLRGDRPDLVGIVPYEGEIKEPETVYFCSEQYDVPDAERDDIRKEIAEKAFLMDEGDYIFPHGVLTVHGPVDMELEEEDGNDPYLVRVSEDAIEFTTAKIGQIVPEEHIFDFGTLEEVVLSLYS